MLNIACSAERIDLNVLSFCVREKLCLCQNFLIHYFLGLYLMTSYTPIYPCRLDS